MDQNLHKELGYVLADLENIRTYVELITRNYSKIIDRLCTMRLYLLNKEKEEQDSKKNAQNFK